MRARSPMCVFCAYKRVYCCIFIAAAGQQINLDAAPLSACRHKSQSVSVVSLSLRPRSYLSALMAQKYRWQWNMYLRVMALTARALRLRPLFLLISFSSPCVCHTDTQFHFLGPFPRVTHVRSEYIFVSGHAENYYRNLIEAHFLDLFLKFSSYGK
jgi:hypothetical protein